jgi:phage I-like protein
MTATLRPIARSDEAGKFTLAEDGFVQVFPFGEWDGDVVFGREKPEGVEGVVQSDDGRWYLPIVQVLDRAAAEACMASFLPDTLLDYEHLSDLPAGESRAGGWGEAAQARDDGLYVRVRWSADGLSDVTGGNYRYLSPVFPWSEMENLGGNRYRPKVLAKAALTNCPRLRGIKAVSNSEDRRLRTEDREALNENPNHADDGKFAEAPGGAGSGGGDHDSRMKAHDEAIKKAKGSEKTKAMQAKLDYMRQRRAAAEAELAEASRVDKAPKKISAHEADALLQQGVSERDPDGNEARFGKRLADYLATKSPEDAAKRKVHLEWARDSVRTTKPVHPEGLGDRVVYAKKFRDDDGEVKGIVTIAGKEIEGFEVFNLYRKDPGKLPNTNVRQAEGRSSGRAAQVYAIADNLFGGFNIAPFFADVNANPEHPNPEQRTTPLNPRVGNTGTAPAKAERKKEKKTMREQLIQALGLSAEATDEQIVAAVGDMQKRLKDVEQAQAEAQVENDLKELGDRVENREAVKTALLKDRAGTLLVLNAMKKPQPATAPAKGKEPVALNSAAAKVPGDDETKKKTGIARAAAAFRKKEEIT